MIFPFPVFSHMSLIFCPEEIIIHVHQNYYTITTAGCLSFNTMMHRTAHGAAAGSLRQECGRASQVGLGKVLPLAGFRRHIICSACCSLPPEFYLLDNQCVQVSV